MTRGMPCRTVRDCLGDYLDGDCPDIVKERVEAHLLECRDCSRHLGELEYVELRLKKALVPMEPSADFGRNLVARLNDAVELDGIQGGSGPGDAVGMEGGASWTRVELPPESFTASVMGRIQEEFAIPDSRRKPWPFARAALVLAAVVLFVFGLLFYRGGLGSRFSQEEEGVASLFQVEEVEGRVVLLDAPATGVGLGLDLPGSGSLVPRAGGSAGGPEGGSSVGPATDTGRKGAEAGVADQPKGKELRPGAAIPLGKEVLVQGGEARIRARVPHGGSLNPGWEIVAGEGSRLRMEKALRSTLRKGRVRIHGGGDEGVQGGEWGRGPRVEGGQQEGGFFLAFPGGGGLLLQEGRAEVRVSEDPWALATGLPEGASRIQVDLEDGKALLLGVRGQALRTLLPGDRALMRPFEPLRIVHGATAADLLQEGSDGQRRVESQDPSPGNRVELRGRLRTSLGTFASGLPLALVLPEGRLPGRTDPAGTFFFRPRIDEMVLGAFLSVSVPGGGTALRFELPPLRPGEKLELDLSLPPIQSLRTRILDPKGAPMQGADLRLYLWEPMLKRLLLLGQGEQVSDPAGRARFVGVPLPRTDQRILLVVEPREGPLFVGYLDRAAYQRLERAGAEWTLGSPPLLSVLLEEPGASELQLEERPRGPAKDLLLRRRTLKVLGGRARVKLALPAPTTLRWWTKDATGARLHEGQVVLEPGKEARVLARGPDRLQLRVLNQRGEGLAGRRFVLLRRKDGLPVFFGTTDKGGFASLLLVDPRAELELRVLEDLGDPGRGEGVARRFDLPARGDLLVARLAFGRIVRGASAPTPAGLPGLSLVRKGGDGRPVVVKLPPEDPTGGKTSGDLELSLTAGGGARVVPSARVYLFSEEGGLAFLGSSDLLGQLRIEELPAGPVLRFLVLHENEGLALASVALRPGETRRLLLDLKALRRVSGRLPGGTGTSGAPGGVFVEVEVLGGPFAGTRTVAIPDPEGRVHLPDLPPASSYRFRYEGYEARLPSRSEARDEEILREGAWKRLSK